MTDMAQRHCEPCSAGATPLTEEEIYPLLMDIPDWRVSDEKGIPGLERTFHFKNFRQALAFTNQVGELAEQQQHHPQVVTEWGKVTVRWWTHKIKGLHRNDFIMAAKTSQLLPDES